MSEKLKVAEEKPVRKVAEIQSEYQQLCTRLGHIEYQVHVFQKDAELLKGTLRELNFEAAKAQKVEAAEAAAKDAEAKAKEAGIEPKGDSNGEVKS